MSHQSRHIQRCSLCLLAGVETREHTKRICPRRVELLDTPACHPEWTRSAYQQNRAIRACTECGQPSTRSRCPRCEKLRKTRPSRSTEERRLSKLRSKVMQILQWGLPVAKTAQEIVDLLVRMERRRKQWKASRA